MKPWQRTWSLFARVPLPGMPSAGAWLSSRHKKQRGDHLPGGRNPFISAPFREVTLVQALSEYCTAFWNSFSTALPPSLLLGGSRLALRSDNSPPLLISHWPSQAFPPVSSSLSTLVLTLAFQRHPMHPFTLSFSLTCSGNEGKESEEIEEG